MDQRPNCCAGASIFAEGVVGAVVYILLCDDLTVFVERGTFRQRTATALKLEQAECAYCPLAQFLSPEMNARISLVALVNGI
jgi:hypothetical protein